MGCAQIEVAAVPINVVSSAAFSVDFGEEKELRQKFYLLQLLFKSNIYAEDLKTVNIGVVETGDYLAGTKSTTASKSYLTEAEDTASAASSA